MLALHILIVCPALAHGGPRETIVGDSPQPLRNIDLEEPVVKKIRHFPVTRGKYTVREEVHKVPTSDHPCRLTNTSVRITFPEMKDMIYVNFLGYKEPNLVQLLRCKGQCSEGVECKPASIKQKVVKMFIKSFLTGGEARIRKQEVPLEEHLECGCQCSDQLIEQCSGRFDPSSCSCGCSRREFGEEQRLCEAQRDLVWDRQACTCVTRDVRVVVRGVEAQKQYSQCRDLAKIKPYIPRARYRIVDVAGWVLLGSCLSLVFILSATTWHYRKEAKLLKSSRREAPNNRRPILNKKKHKVKEGSRFSFRKEPNGSAQPRNPATQQPSLRSLENLNIAIENSMLLSGGSELYHEQYDEHGVRLDSQCFT